MTTAATSSGSEERYQPASKLLRLPLDLTIVIFDLLEIHDAVAFSLTCKGIHHHFFADARSRLGGANHEDHYKVQTMLEKDLPHDQIYCPYCGTFHSLDPKYRKKFCREQDHDESHTFATFLRGQPAISLKYLDARAIVNAVLFKRPDALKKLMELQTCSLDGAWPPWHQYWYPKIIGGQLFLKVEASHVRRTAAEDQHEFSYSVCKHMHVYGKFPHLWVHHSQTRYGFFFGSRKKFAATCRMCGTDWMLDQEWIGDTRGPSNREGWSLSIESWHCLGDVRSPFRSSWSHCSGMLRNPDPRWIAGDTSYIIDHHDWDRQMQRFREIAGRRARVIGPNEKSWIKASEWGVKI